MIDWLASYPKSGNTWMRLFLAAYRNHGHPVRAEMLEPSSGDVAEVHYLAVSPIPLTSLKAEQIMLLRPAALMHAHQCRFLKSHWARLAVNGIDSIPDAITNKAVYIVRDPRAVCGSLSEWLDKSLEETVAYMNRKDATLDGHAFKHVISFLGTWSFHVESWMNHEDTLVVKYEDMVAEPMDTFARVIEHFGGFVDKGVLKKAIEVTSFDTLKAEEDREGFVFGPKNGGSFFGEGSSRSVPKKIAKAIETDHGAVMEKLGYLS